MFNRRTRIREILAMEPAGQPIIAMGWVRTFRNNQFIALNDGSTNTNLQVVAELGLLHEHQLKRITTGASLKVEGELVASLGKGQKAELKAKQITVLGDSDAEKYPLQPKEHSLEFLREKAHLRFRTNTFGAIFRVRHALAFAVHQFYHNKGFLYMHTPVITASDAEGAGEMFRVTTLDIKEPPVRSSRLNEIAEKYYDQMIMAIPEGIRSNVIGKINSKLQSLELGLNFKKLILANTEDIKSLTSQKRKLAMVNEQIEEIFSVLVSNNFFEKTKRGPTNELCFPSWLTFLIVNKPHRTIALKRRYSSKSFPYLSLSFFNFSAIQIRLPREKDAYVDFSQDFFGRSTNLTVSGQLEGELAAMAFSEIYTFGPTFRAENSNTTRHLAEFWMIEPEMAFYDIEDNMDLAEEFIKYVIRFVMDNNREDLDFLSQRLQKEESKLPQQQRSEFGLIEKLEMVVNNKFERITYTQAIEILLDSPAYKKKKFQYEVKWGSDLQSEHERYLVEKHFKKPVIVTGYPKDIKSFYMRVNEDDKTVAAMDILAPGIGEIVGGSQREERLEKLLARMEQMHIPTEELWWYLDTRRFGSVPHSGFGLGFERLVLFVTGMTNIRDVIAFPRTPKNAEF